MNEKGQASIEIIVLTVVIITLTTFVVLRFAAQQNDIFVTAAARQAFIGETQSLQQTTYLEKVEAIECPEEYRVFLFANPDPNEPSLEGKIANKIQETIGNTKNVEVHVNPINLERMLC
ncbi:MAG TPA: hypothetical protein VFF13_00485 [archaeon]|nr:hypothetical protein [archaeon]